MTTDTICILLPQQLKVTSRSISYQKCPNLVYQLFIVKQRQLNEKNTNLYI